MKVTKHIPNLLTSLNLFTGLMGIVNVFTGDYTNTIFFILLAGFFDFLDGFAARAFGATGDFGKELDSLADLVSFGVLPSLVIFRILENQYNHELIPFLGLVIAIFSALRLAKFNLDTEQTDKFLGLPTPANAILLTTFAQLPDSITEIPYIFIVLSLVSCFLLVSRIEMLALKFKDYNFLNNLYRYLLILIVFMGLLVIGIEILPWIIPAYLILSIISNLASGKKA